MNKPWHVEFETDDWQHCYLIIYCPTKDDVKPILKKHMQGKPYRIKKISECPPECTAEYKIHHLQNGA